MPKELHRTVFREPHNRKLGPGIYSFSIPAGPDNCPGATTVCASICYAKRGHFVWPSLQRLNEQARALTDSPKFVQYAVDDIKRRNIRVVRIHVAGDFYADQVTADPAAYVKKWQKIVERSPHTRFFAYTRSWAIPELLPALRKLGALPNMQLWFSTDRATGAAPEVPGIRQAFVAAYVGDKCLVPATTDLVFRNVDRHVQEKKILDVQVCPVEDGIPRKITMTCSLCGICWKPPKPRQELAVSYNAAYAASSS